MIDNNFDKILKEKLDSYQEEMVDSSVWEGIESRLNKKSRRSMIRKVSLFTTAAAACLLAGIFLFRGEGNIDTLTFPTVEIAQNDNTKIKQIATPEEVTILKEDDKVATLVADNIQKRRGEVAITKESSAKEQITEGQPVENQSNQLSKEQSSKDQASKEQASEDRPSKEKAEKSKKDEVIPITEQIASFEDAFAQSLPLGYLEDDEPTKTQRNTSISILSNVTSVASPGSIMVDMGPAHASSQSGKVAGNSSVTPISDSPKFYMPISLGLQLKARVVGNFYVGAGLNYSYLVSQYNALVNSVYYEGAFNQLYYVGIPVTLYYHFVNSPRLGVYASLGGAVDKCVSSRYVYGSNVSHENVSGLQYSANLGLGVEYKITKGFGIYLDPSIAYFFDNKQPLSIRTAQPLQLKLELGFRFAI